MKKHTRNTRGPGAWVLGGVASVLMCVSAFGQYVATQPTAITIPDSGTGNPYPSTIDLTRSNILGTIEKVSVTVNNVTHPYAPDVALLLVGPNGKGVVLMSNAGGSSTGGNTVLSGETFVFSDDASGGAPTTSPLVSGSSYKPTNNGSDNGALSFPASAPTPPYATTLTSAFGGSSPNGVWSLYVLDTQAGPPTSLSPQVGSWSLSLNTTPTVALSTNLVRVAEGGSATLNLTVQSSSVAAGSLTVAPTALPNLVTNFSVGGTASNPTLTITPNATTYGTNTLTLTVNDGIGSVTTNVTLEVFHVIQPPFVSLSTNSVTTIAGMMTTNVVVATLTDADINFDPNTLANLNLTVTSSDSTIVAPSGVFFDFLTPGGDKRSITVIPAGTGTGTATLTITVDNGSIQNSQTLTVNVLPVAHPIYANSASITAPAAGNGSTTITVPTISGLIGQVSVLVNGLKNVGPSTTFTLTAPGSVSVPLLTTSPSATLNSYGQILFADGASGTLPTGNDETNTISLAPASPLSALIGTAANGTWTLTVANGGGAQEQIIDGWTLNVYAAPTIASIANVYTNEETTLTTSFNVGDIDGTVTNVTASIPSAPGFARFTTSLSGNTVNLTIQGNFNQYGTNTVQVVAMDNNGFTATGSFTLGLAFVDHAPSVGFVGRQVTSAGSVLGPITVSVADVDTPLNLVTLSATSDNQKLIPNANLVLQPTGPGTYSLTIFPMGTSSDTANITLTANDGTKTGSTVFQVFVQAPGVPLFGSSGAIFIVPSAPGIPYPSTNTVSGLIGNIEHVSVTLFDITDPTPGNLQLLLVSPTGTNVLLMEGAGGNNPLDNTTLVFDDSASGQLPQNGQIESGSFQLSDFGSPTALASPAPGLPYYTTLANFAGTNANGNWVLYVADNGSPSSTHGAAISGGWQLSIQTAPSIPTIKDQYTTENTPLRVTVTVGDNEPGVNLTVTATGDASLFQPIAVTGSGSTRTLTITPQPYAYGTNTITVTATDPAGKTATQTFNMGIQFIAQPPLFISAPGNQTVNAATQLPPVSFQVWPPQGGALTVTASSPDNPSLVQSVQVTQTGSQGGTNTYSLTLLPSGVQTGTATITITATDANHNTASSSFTLTVKPILAFANSGAISIPQGPLQPGALQQGESTPYPSVINVSGLGGVVSSVQVTLVGLNHQYPHDLDVLLVGPDGKTAVMLMAHAALYGTATEARLTFQDGSPTIPATFGTPGPLNSGVYGPSDYSSGLTLPAPAPARPYAGALAGFNGLTPNGNWSLYVIDDTYPTGGSIDTGWILFLQTAPAVGGVVAQSTLENTPLKVPLNFSDSTIDPTNLIITAVATTNFPPTLVTNLTLSGSGASQTLTITPSPNLPSAYNALNGLTNLAGSSLITVTAADPINNLTNTTSFNLTVQYVNQPPTSSPATTNTLWVNENAAATIGFTIGDVDSIIDKTNIVVTSSDQGLLGNSNIVVTGSAVAPGQTGTFTVQATPNHNMYGSGTLTLVATDGNSYVTNTVGLNVVHIWQTPTISAIASPQPVIAGNPTTNIVFTVNSVEVASTNLLVYAQSSNPNLVPNTPANIVLGGAGNSRTIQLFSTIPNVLNPSTITIYVTDQSLNVNSTNSTTFTLVPTSVNNQFGNTASISTSGAGTANLYPSTINVSGLVGATYKVSAIIPDLSHSSPANLDLLLVEEDADGKTHAVVLMSGAGDATAVNNLRVIFDDSGTALPNNGTLTSATYQPANFTKGLILPLPAPTNTLWSASLGSAFGGFNPNGNWKLYVNDRGAGDIGSLPAGWQLIITTAPTITAPAPSPLTITENSQGSVGFTLGDMVNDVSNLVVSVTSDNPTLIPTRNVSFSGPPNNSAGSGAVTATITPAQLQNGSAHLTFTVTRSDGASASTTLLVNVTPINVPPTISRLSNLTMNENGSKPATQTIQFLVSDSDTPLSSLIIQATSDNQQLIPSTSLTFFSSGTNQLFGLPNNNFPQTSLISLNITPQSFKTGTANITVMVTDPMAGVGTNTVSSSFTLTVNSVVFPPFFISTPGPASVAAGGTLANVPFQVASPVDAANSLTMSGHSSDQTLVKDSNIVFGTDASGTNRTVTITSQPDTAGGTATITLTVNDPTVGNVSSANTQYAITVRPSRVRNYVNSTPISIPLVGNGSPYPSTLAVSNLVGPISKVTATLNGFAHTFPSDVGVLLVGPSGQQIVLQNFAGGGTPVANVNLTFDQSAGGPIPENLPLATGTYQPFDYRNVSFANPAPQMPYTNTLNAFNGTNPNGTWSLYVEDFVSPDSGGISNGWSLAITTLPVMNGLVNTTNQENTVAREAFTTADDTLSTPTFTFSATSDNQNVVTNNGIVFSGGGTNWVVTVYPVPNASGVANITVTMVNGDGQTVQTTFVANFTQVFYPPVVAAIPDTSINAGSAGSVALSYSDIGYSQNQLSVAFQSSNQGLVPNANLKQVGNQLVIAPLGIQTGTSVITVSVTNPNNQTTSTNFTLTVTPSPIPVYANTSGIVINDDNPATPYPSTLAVSGLSGNISKVTATLVGVTHSFPSDVSILLVGPQGQAVVLMSHAGGSAALSNARLTFDDAAGAVLPQFSVINDGTYQPTDYKSSDSYFQAGQAGGPPVAPYSHALNAFTNTSPNGTWSLFVQDDPGTPAPNGAIAGGWILSITTTGPSISSPGPQTTPENTPLTVVLPVSSTTVNASNLIVTATNTADSPTNLIASLTVGGFGGSRNLTITPTLNLPSMVTTNDGTNIITVTVTDGTLTNTISFPLTVTYVNQPPTVTGLTDGATPANVPLVENFTIADVDNPISNLVVGVSTSVPGLGTATVSGSAGAEVLTYNPKGVLGTNVVSVTVSDGINTTTNVISVISQPGLAPVVSALTSQTIPAVLTTSSIKVPFTVDSGPLGATNLSVVASADNTTLVPLITVTGSGSNFNATIAIAGATLGSANITVFARDEFGIGTNGFTLTVRQPAVPVLGPIADVSVPVNTPTNLLLSVASPDTALNKLTWSVAHTNNLLLKGVAFSVSGSNEVAALNVVSNMVGNDFVTISVTDGFTNVSQSFKLTVTPTAPISISPIGVQNTVANTPAKVALPIVSPSTSVTNLTLTGTSTNKALVSNITFSYNGRNMVATVNLLPNRGGKDYITITATDGFSSASQSFVLNVSGGTTGGGPTLAASVSGNQLHLTFAGAANTSYTVQSSTDLSHWTTAATVTTDATGAGSYTPTITGGALFFRTSGP